MSILHIEGFEQYAAQADLGYSYVLTGTGVWEISDDTPLGRGKSVKSNQPAVNHNGLIKPIRPVAQGQYVGSSFWLKMTTLPYAAFNRALVLFCEGNTIHAGIWINDGGYLVASRTTTDIAPYFSRPLLLNVWYHIEVRAKVDDTQGEVEIRVNGNTWGAVNGLDTRNGSTGVVDTVRLLPVNISTANRQGVFLADSWVIWDTQGNTNNSWIGDAEVMTVFPNADDALGSWVPNTGAAWDAINDAGSDGDTTFIASSTVDDEASFSLGALPVTPEKVLAVASQVVSRKTDSGARSISHGVVSGTEEALSDPASLGVSYAGDSAVFETDPDTGLPWTPAAVAAIKSKIKVAA